MKLLDALPTIFILGLVAFLSWIGYSVYEDYVSQKDQNAPGTVEGGQKANSFGAFIDDSLFSIGQSPQDLSNAQATVWSDPVGSLKSILGIGDAYPTE